MPKAQLKTTTWIPTFVLLTAITVPDGVRVLAQALDPPPDRPLTAINSDSQVPPQLENTNDVKEQRWNFHMQNTDIGQLHPSFRAKYSGPNSLNSGFESDETVAWDVFGGVGLWKGAELHVDALAWQGFGLSHTLG